MARRVFYSFDYERDAVRVQQVKNMGVLAGQTILTSNRWEEVTGGTKRGIKKYIDEQMEGKSCVVVLIGKRAGDREWVKYEIEKAWKEERGLVGVFIHNLADMNKLKSAKGTNPFRHFTVGHRKIRMNLVVPVYDPPGPSSSGVYKWIEKTLPAMVEEGIKVRNDFVG
jgi:hypothetical protein